ncbi:hypothetical protein [Caulobacter henricii]|uniref:hypothetical protein n=1 Tax=Caulobacter henricii TaxID=69395 RepID=UPI001412BE10|nr:hypothetical protein [Caulobacter henricii]
MRRIWMSCFLVPQACAPMVLSWKVAKPLTGEGTERVLLAGIVILGLVLLLLWPSVERPLLRALRHLRRRRP